MAVSRLLPTFAKNECGMLQFKQYPSIGRASDEAWMARVRAAVSPNTLFAVQEKVHGANVSFLTDGLDVKMARRTAVIQEGEPFFGYEAVLDRYEWQVVHIFNRLSLRHRDMTSLAVYGELCGGYYPHPLVANRWSKPVQKGVWYCPWVDFYAFDIYVFTGEGGFFLSVKEASDLFSLAGIPYARTLFSGTLDDCLGCPCPFPTTVPAEWGLPPIEGNLCEGIVIKPLDPILLPDGARVAIKIKRF